MIYKLKIIPTFIFLLLINTQIIANSIVAIVDDEIITMNSIANEIKSESTKAEKIDLVNAHIDLYLQMKKVSDLGLEPTSIKLEKVLSNVAANNNLTFEQLKSLKQYNEIVEKVSQQLALQKLKDFSMKGVVFKPTQDEIDIELAIEPSPKKTIKQLRISQIIISEIDSADSSNSLDDILEKELLRLTKTIQNGTAFADIAKLHSQSPSYVNGGLSEWLEFDKLPKLYKEIINKLPNGEISRPFKTKNDWRIIKVSSERLFDPHIQKIVDKLTKNKIDKHYKEWVKGLRKDAYIEIFEEKF
jgi:peptidyl-prolyl cis-trans isomerase SurA